jgi:hypothetical protein
MKFLTNPTIYMLTGTDGRALARDPHIAGKILGEN